MSQPDSPEVRELIDKYASRAMQAGLSNKNFDIGGNMLDKLVETIHEYYTNKFLEALPKKKSERGLDSGMRASAYGWNMALADTTKAIKQLSKRGE